MNRPCRSTTLSISASSTARKTRRSHSIYKKSGITQPTQTFEIVVDQMPTRAGIDPYNKLIDRDSDDNMTDVVNH